MAGVFCKYSSRFRFAQQSTTAGRGGEFSGELQSKNESPRRPIATLGRGEAVVGQASLASAEIKTQAAGVIFMDRGRMSQI